MSINDVKGTNEKLYPTPWMKISKFCKGRIVKLELVWKTLENLASPHYKLYAPPPGFTNANKKKRNFPKVFVKDPTWQSYTFKETYE